MTEKMIENNKVGVIGVIVSDLDVYKRQPESRGSEGSNDPRGRR